MKEHPTKETKGPGLDILKRFMRAELIVKHAKMVNGWPWWARTGHRLLVGWRCPACVAFKNGEHEGWGFKI